MSGRLCRARRLRPGCSVRLRPRDSLHPSGTPANHRWRPSARQWRRPPSPQAPRDLESRRTRRRTHRLPRTRTPGTSIAEPSASRRSIGMHKKPSRTQNAGKRSPTSAALQKEHQRVDQVLARLFLGVTLGMNVERQARRHVPLTSLANPGRKTELDTDLHTAHPSSGNSTCCGPFHASALVVKESGGAWNRTTDLGIMRPSL